jgi:hypothetical protein
MESHIRGTQGAGLPFVGSTSWAVQAGIRPLEPKGDIEAVHVGTDLAD